MHFYKLLRHINLYYNISGSKMKAKTKTKKSDRKFTRHKLTPKDSPQIETPICDFSNLCKPIDTSLSNLVQVTKLLETANDEIKYILTYECEVIYECKICRSLFRSLLNFISHKRIYCPEQFNISNHKDVINPQVMVCKYIEIYITIISTTDYNFF